VTQDEYERALLLTKIEAQRSVLGLEIRLARAGFDPMRTALSLLGVDRAAAGSVAWSLRSLFGGGPDGLGGGGALVPVLVAALLPLVERFRTNPDEVSAPAAPPGAEPGPADAE
jgi:hypothetical protein